jgi:DNA polymerase V
MFALVDGNNFYVSCERVFAPQLENRPVVVLSNNDGCIISRSNEAKALGFKMAEPVHKQKELIRKENVAVFSSNYVLYGDMSNRMVSILRHFTPDVEVYSIDEAFLNISGILTDYTELGQRIRQTILKNIGIPVGVGIGSTKTLAKIANKISKKNNGVFLIDTETVHEWALQTTEVGDVWGIGRQYAKLLNGNGVKTAFDFAQLDPAWIKKKMGVVGQRVQEELLGTPCIPIETMMQPKKNIATTRSFGTRLSDIKLIGEAVSTHAVRCAEKLRKQKSVANHVTVFIHTNPFSETEKYISRSFTVTLLVASNSNFEIAKAALCALKQIHQPCIRYKKTGVIVSGLSSQTFVQGNLFEGVNNESFKQLSKVTDVLNNRYGRDAVKLAVQGNSKEWQLKHENLSNRYTTRWDELLKVKT